MAACINVAAAVVAALYTEVATQRYIFALYSGPFVALAAFLALSRGKILHYMLLPLAVFSFLFIPSFDSFKKPLHSYPKDLACLDEIFQKHSVETGYSGYWPAKYISFLGKEKVQLNQIFPWGGPYRWLTSERWYENARTKKGRHDVILMDQLQKELIIEKIKVDPDAVVRCGPYEAWLYAIQKRPALLKLIE